MDAKRHSGENGTNERTRRTVLLGLGGATTLGLAGCLGSDGDEPATDQTDAGGDPSPQPTTQPSGDGNAPVDLRMFPPSHNKDAFGSFSIAYESVVLTTTDGSEVSIPVERTASLISDSSATGVSVAENLAVPAGKYEVIEVHYSIEEAVTTDGETAEIEYTSPGSVNVVEMSDEPSSIEASNPYVLQTHFALISEPWTLSMPTIVIGPGMPD